MAETTLAAADQKLEAMRELTVRSTIFQLGMPDVFATRAPCPQGITASGLTRRHGSV
jgi:hypothetical protein